MIFFAHIHERIPETACMLETRGHMLVLPGTSPRLLIVTTIFGNLLLGNGVGLENF